MRIMQSANDTIFKTKIPVYNDGTFRLFKIKQGDEKYPTEELVDTEKDVDFEELSLTDKLRFEAEQREIKITGKIRIAQSKEINSLSVIKIADEFYSVYNVYHFINEDGYKLSDITLQEYKK